MGGGGKKLNTGIKVLDNATNAVVGTATGGLVGNSFSETGKEIEKGVAGLGKNIERNVGTSIKNTIALTQKGGFNNIGSTIAQLAATNYGFGMINPEDVSSVVGETNTERMESEAVAKSADDQANATNADIAAAQAESERQVAASISGIVERRRRSPGKGLSLLTGGAETNTLLKLSGKK